MEYTTPLRIDPGESLQHEVVVREGGGSVPQFGVEQIPGTYRVLYGIFESWDRAAAATSAELRSPLPEEKRRSNEFLVIP